MHFQALPLELMLLLLEELGDGNRTLARLAACDRALNQLVTLVL